MEVLPVTKDETPIARSPHVLVSLIKAKIQNANDAAKEAAEEAARPYWLEVAELLMEAKASFDRVSEFYEWASRNFGFSERTTARYVSTVTSIAPHQRARVTTISDAVRAAGNMPRGADRGGMREWRQPVDDIAERARRDAARIRDAELTRQQEREAERQLALRLIDIGYKVLVKELHPDKGGSRDAMIRLNTVRDRLKAHA